MSILLQPFLNAALQFIIAVVTSIAPEAAADLKEFFDGVASVIADAIDLQMTPGEALDSLKIRANELKARGETILIELQASAEEFPAEIFGTLTGLFGTAAGALEKVIGV